MAARLTLLHVVPARLSRVHQRQATRTARTALDAAIRELALAQPDSVVTARVETGSPTSQIALHAGATQAELIVMGSGGTDGIQNAFLGTTAERVVRRRHSPVLVVRRQPCAPYRRPALAVDVDSVAGQAFAWLLRLVPPPPWPPLTLIHALAPPFEGLIETSLSTDDARASRTRHEQWCVRELARSFAGALADARVAPSDAPAIRTYLRYGPAATVIHEIILATMADLVVLGTHARSRPAYAILGGVALDVLRGAPCDVLVVPPRRRDRRGT